MGGESGREGREREREKERENHSTLSLLDQKFRHVVLLSLRPAVAHYAFTLCWSRDQASRNPCAGHAFITSRDRGTDSSTCRHRQNIDRTDGTAKQRQKEKREKELSNSNAPDVASTSSTAAAAAAASAAAAAMMFAGRSGQSQYWWPGSLHFRHGFGQSLCLCPTPRQL